MNGEHIGMLLTKIEKVNMWNREQKNDIDDELDKIRVAFPVLFHYH
ncbi:hypothetical protein BleG1_2059 [Shouchella lehensis G1]|uniref:Uncharacterized protein n=1 Tax=Shouchella lehensis G1 TaxID=1246626 RepID=A0A060LWS6_9BACI|nr:hypothetical protein BleG1_2059 [Shouchella lehensis G1]